MSVAYMLDTNICSFIIRKRPAAVLERLQAAVEGQDSTVISVVTYYELFAGAAARRASPSLAAYVREFVARASAILAWDVAAAEEAVRIRNDLASKGNPIGGNDTMIAGHALAAGCVLVTNNTREFARVKDLKIEDWTA